jgi:hypothetical protein
MIDTVVIRLVTRRLTLMLVCYVQSVAVPCP